MRTTKRIAIALVALGACLAPSAVAHAAPAPAWQLNLISLPTNLAPGTTGGGTAPLYMATATNVGAGNAAGKVTLKVTLPEDVTPLDPSSLDNDQGSPDPVCAKPVDQTVTCTAAGPVRPSRTLIVKIPVEVAAPPTLEPGDVLADATASIESPGTIAVNASAPTTIDTEPPPFGFLAGRGGLATLFTEEDGSPSLLAGRHPDQFTVDVGFPVELPDGSPITTNAGHPRDIVTDLPPGVVINPNATAVRCTEAELLSGGGEPGCPDASQIGIVNVLTESAGPALATSALYNMVPPPGAAAMVAFNAANAGIYVHLSGGVRSETDFGLFAESTDTLALGASPLEHVQAQLWGKPTDSSHDQIRGACRGGKVSGCSVDPLEMPLITMPSACSEQLTTEAHARSWEESEAGVEELLHHAEAQATDVSGVPTSVSGCSLLDFDPSLTLRPDTDAAETPSGMEVEVRVPQSEGAEPATSTVRDVTIAFPQGVAVNPAAADGFQACSPAQIGLKTGVGEAPQFTDARPQCPDASKIGSVEVSTPLLDHTVTGAVYAATPFENPFGTLLGAYVVIDSPQDGIVVKLAGRTEADPSTGQLTASFEEAPQLPFASFEVNLFGGPRAVLRTPSTCGTYTTTSTYVPWSGTAAVEKTDSFTVSRGPNGRPCVLSEAQMPHAPGFEAGTLTPLAAGFSPFAGRLTRQDGDQQLKGLNATLPPGLTGKLAGVETCSDAAIAVAAARSGRDEQASPSCPAGSQIGQITAGAGAGPTPFYTSGKIYLAGPYKGAPISGVAITPAVAGPFDLGTVVVRAPGRIDPITAQLRVESDEFPHILEGIPLELRDARLSLDRPEFTLNPTNCEPMAILGEATSLLGAVAPLRQRFQVGGCRGLDYEPKLAIRLFGGTKRGGHPRLRATLTAKLGEANTARASVALPRSVFLDQSHIRTVCTRVQFAADNCPAGAIYGHARAITPLLDEPVEGPVYLRSSSNELPDMVAALRGPASKPIEIELIGRIDSVNGGIRSTFDAVPDQPVSKFVLNMKGGNRGLVINSRDLCKRTYRATAKFTGQNGKAHNFRPAMRNDCKKPKKSKRARPGRAR